MGHLLKEFPGLKLYEADLLKSASFKDCFEGCKFVVHTASPFKYNVTNPQFDLVDPAVKGTFSLTRNPKH